MRNAPKNFREVCILQNELDIAVSKPRDNGFNPSERTDDKIRLSAIAECIEFNEELKETHKTWKQKDTLDQKLQLEELTDIMFFIAQLFNKNNITDCDYAISTPEEDMSINGALLDLICNLSKDSNCYEILQSYGVLINTAKYSLDEVYDEYLRKWNINMNRINKDWTLK